MIFVSSAAFALETGSSFSHGAYACPYAEFAALEGEISLRPGILFGYKTNFGIRPSLSLETDLSCLLSGASNPGLNGILRGYVALAAELGLSYSFPFSDDFSGGASLGAGAALGSWAGTELYFAFPLISARPFLEYGTDSLLPFSLRASLPFAVRFLADRPCLTLGLMLTLSYFPLQREALK